MKIAYLTTCFGTPSHTFIRREIRELRNRGVSVDLYGIRQDDNIAPDAEDLSVETRYLYPLAFLSCLCLNFHYALFRPTVYWSSIIECFSKDNGSFKQRIKLIYHLCVSVVHAKSLENEGIEHIHAHFLNVAASVTLFCSRLTGIPYSVTVHSAGERDLPHVIGIPIKLKYAKSLLMISQFNINYYDAIYPCREKSSVIRCGIEIDDFPLREQSPPTQTLNILAVGRFVEKKGFIYLVNAAKELIKKGISVRVEILGDGPLMSQVYQVVDDENLSSVIKLSGFLPTVQVREKMLQADVVVVPSVTSATGEMEGIPVVLMEAMALGCPVIASAHSGIPELVNEKTGVLVPEKDSVKLAQAIEHYQYSKERTLRARQLIEEQFNIHRVVDQRIQLFS